METDFNYSVMTELAKHFKIHWIVLGSRNNYISESKLDIFKKLPDFHVEWNTKKYRMRDFRSLIYYYRLYTNIKFISPDIVYCNVAPDPFFRLSLFFLIVIKQYLQLTMERLKMIAHHLALCVHWPIIYCLNILST